MLYMTEYDAEEALARNTSFTTEVVFKWFAYLLLSLIFGLLVTIGFSLMVVLSPIVWTFLKLTNKIGIQ